MRNHKVFNFFSIAGIKFRRYVCGNRHGGRIKFERIQESTILRHGRTHNSRVEGMRYRNLYGLNSHIGKHFNSIIYGFAGTGDNRLRRAVFICHSYISADTGELRFNTFHGSGDRSHFTIIFYFNFAHYFTAGTYGFKTVFKGKMSRFDRKRISVLCCK